MINNNVIDHVPDIDPDAEEHAAILRDVFVAHSHDGLELDRTFDSADNARKLGQDAVAGGVDEATAIAAYQWEDHGLMSLDVVHRRGIVLAHQAAVAGAVLRILRSLSCPPVPFENRPRAVPVGIPRGTWASRSIFTAILCPKV